MSKRAQGVRLTTESRDLVAMGMEQSRTSSAWTGRVRAVTLGLALLLLACLDDRPALFEPRNPEATPPVATAVVSNPEPRTSAFRGRVSLAVDRAGGTDVVYVSLQPGTAPNGGFATIRNARTGSSVPAAMADGGFDPVPIEAGVGDTLAVVVELAGGGRQSMMMTVPATRPPVVVRTDPPPRKRDVPLNAYLVAVFSEPVRASSVRGIQLLLAGAPVSGHATLSTDGLRAEFQPDNLLAPNAAYTLSIPTDVADLSGDRLQQSYASAFTTGTTVIAASVATEQAALITNPFSGKLRAFNMSAMRQGDGTVSGSWSIFYPETGVRVFGRVTCFTVRGGDSAWVAGVVDGAGDTSSVGQEDGWRVVDHGPPAGGIPDELSLAWPLADYGIGPAQNFCASTPVLVPPADTINVYPINSGNIVVNGSGPPPPPPANTVSEIAFAAWPYGGIQVIKADGSGGRVLTSDSGDFSPNWSPDGTKLAFDRYNRSKSGRDIYVINADGSGLKRLTNDGFDDSDPAWSPNGSQIAFGRSGRIFTMNASDGSIAAALTSGGFDWHPTWSPDGRRIAFGSDRTGTNAIYVMNADGSGVRQLRSDAAGDYVPWWSPDGTTIAFELGTCCANSVYLINADGTAQRRLAIVGRTPSWSPDSRALVFEWFGLHVVSPDGTGIVPLGPGYDPAWSPVGSVPLRPQPAAWVTITPAADTMAVGDTVRFVATVKDAAGNVLHGRVVAWVSGDSAAASGGSTVATDPPRYSVTWLVAATAPGTAKIIAAIDGKSDTAMIAVRPAPAATWVSPRSADVLLGGATQLHATALDASGIYYNDPAGFAWTSSNPGVATVDTRGLVTGVSIGSATVTATSHDNGLSASAMVTTTVLSSGFVVVEAGYDHACGLLASGAAYCWGSDKAGSLGGAGMSETCGQYLATYPCSRSPVAVAGRFTFRSLAVGLVFHACGVTTSGAAYCWGDNTDGQLGDGSTRSSSVPVAVAGGLSFRAVSASESHTCGVTTSGPVYCWGYNAYGQLGDGSTTFRSSPVVVAGGLAFASVISNGLLTCGLSTTAAAYCWGDNRFGGLGDGSTTSSPVPVPVAGGLTFSVMDASCGVTTGGGAYCWGENSYGRLGVGTYSGPEQCRTYDPDTYPPSGPDSLPCSRTPVAVTGGLTFSTISGSWSHTCGVTTTGAAYCWGDNTYGQLGDGSTSSSLVPVAVTGGLTFRALSARGWRTCGVATNGTSYCWGAGLLGGASETSSSVPVKVAGQP